MKAHVHARSDGVLRILHLEDSIDDRYFIHRRLAAHSLAVEITDVENEADFVRAFETEAFDLILADMVLPGYNGLAALYFVRRRCPDIPFIFVSGSMSQEIASESLKEGATDYVPKDRLNGLIAAIERAVHQKQSGTKVPTIPDARDEQMRCSEMSAN